MKKKSALQFQLPGKAVNGVIRERTTLRFSPQTDIEFTTKFKETGISLEKVINTFMTGVSLKTCEMPTISEEEKAAKKEARRQEEKAILKQSLPLFDHFIDCLDKSFGQQAVRAFLEPLTEASLTQEAKDKLASLNKDKPGLEDQFYAKDTKRHLYNLFSRYLLAYRKDPAVGISTIFKTTSVAIYKSSVDHAKIRHISNRELAESGIFFNAAAQPKDAPVKHNLHIRVFDIGQLKAALTAVASENASDEESELAQTFKDWTDCDSIEAYCDHPVGMHASNIGNFTKGEQDFYYINGNITDINKLAIQRAPFKIDLEQVGSGIQISQDDTVNIDAGSSEKIKSALFAHPTMNTNPNNENEKTKTLEQLANAGIYLSANNDLFSIETQGLTDKQFKHLTGYITKADYLEAHKNHQIALRQDGDEPVKVSTEPIQLHLSDEVIQSCPKSNDDCKEEETRQTILKELFERTEEAQRIKLYQQDNVKTKAFQDLQKEQKAINLDKSKTLGKFPMIKIGMQHNETQIAIDSQHLTIGCDDESGTTTLPDPKKIHQLGTIKYQEETQTLALVSKDKD